MSSLRDDLREIQRLLLIAESRALHEGAEEVVYALKHAIPAVQNARTKAYYKEHGKAS